MASDDKVNSDHSSRRIPARSWLQVVIQCLQASPLENQPLRFQFSECAGVVAQRKWVPMLSCELTLKPGGECGLRFKILQPL